MTVKIINLAAMRPSQPANADKTAAPAPQGAGASFDAALSLRRAAHTNGGTPPRAMPEGHAAGDKKAPAKDLKDGALSVRGLHLRLAGASGAATAQEKSVSGAAADTPAAADDKILPEALAGELPRTIDADTLPASAGSLHPVVPDASRDAAPSGAEAGHETPPTAAARDAALSGVTVAGAAAVVAGAVRATSSTSSATRSHPATADGERLMPRTGRPQAAQPPAVAAAGEAGTPTPLDAEALRAKAQPGTEPRDTFVLARGAVTPEGRAPVGAGESTHVFSPAAPTAAPAGTPAAGAPVFTAPLNAPVGSDQWNQALKQQSLRLSHFGDGRAELTLHPRDLGQIQVSLKMGEQTQLHFASANAQVRAAVEAALPQLRHAFAESGINLGQASVSDQGNQQFGSEQQPHARTHGFSDPVDETSPAPVAVTTIAGRTADGGIDIFA